MNISDLIDQDRIACNAEAASKKRVLELMSELLSRDTSGPAASEVFDGLFERERLGSTGLGHGIALPHARIKSGTRPVGAFARMKGPIDFDSPDDRPVDLVFGLVVPEESTDEHLQILAELATLLDNDDICDELRRCTTAEELVAILSRPPPQAE